MKCKYDIHVTIIIVSIFKASLQLSLCATLSLNPKLLPHVAGTDRVVLGDLVYCKGNETEKVSEVVSSECVDENGNDTLDPIDLDDISGTNLPEERLNLVKVSCVQVVGFFPCCPKQYSMIKATLVT